MDTLNSPPAKRLRTEDDAEAATSIRVMQSDALWYPDGNTILQAEQTQFRVHKSILAQHSTVFRDMFLVGSPEVGDMIEGCPLVILHDSAEDMAHMLQAIYNPLNSFNTRNTMSFKVKDATIRLGKKYGGQGFYSNAVSLIVDELPTSLKEWDDSGEVFRKFECHDGLEFEVLRLARDANILCVVPQALYCCYGYANDSDIESLCLGVTNNDGHHVTPLRPSDLMVCVRGYNRLCKASAIHVGRWARDRAEWQAEECEEFVGCQTAVKDITAGLFDDSSSETRFQLVSHSWDPDIAAELCNACADRLEARWNEWREDIWNNLPSYYDLPPWEELRASSELQLEMPQ